MKIKTLMFLMIVVLFGLGMTMIAGNRASESQTADSQRHLERMAAVLKLDVGRLTNHGVVRNMVGIRSDHVLFSQRLDSRTYFIQDDRYGPDKPAGVVKDSDSNVIERSRSILGTLEIPADEVSKANVLREKNQTGYVDPRTRKMVLQVPGEGKVFAEFWRAVNGVPVFSSRALIGLTSQGTVGYMETHWPIIPKSIIDQARRLQETVRSGWRPPARKDATVESVEAGIIHSPAVGFVMDIYPTIRVIYKPLDGRVGRKPTLYLDGNGKELPVPRQFEKVEQTPDTKRPAKT